MSALVWRLHRNQALFTAVTLVAFTIAFIVSGVALNHAYHTYLSACAATGICDLRSALGTYNVFSDMTELTMAVPLLLGLFWGAPLIARELEDNTIAFAWTQGVTRRRWLTWNVGSMLLGGALWGAVMAAGVSWWRTTDNVAMFPSGRLSPWFFDIQGIVPIAYAVFAIALGIFLGVVVKRAVPAIALTLGVFAGARIIIADFVRPHLLPVATLRLPFGNGNSLQRSGAWILSRATFSGTGQLVKPPFVVTDFPAACRPGGTQSFGGVPACLNAHGWHTVFAYQPAGRFWPFQSMEAGIFLVLSALAIWLTYKIVLRRDV